MLDIVPGVPDMPMAGHGEGEPHSTYKVRGSSRRDETRDLSDLTCNCHLPGSHEIPVSVSPRRFRWPWGCRCSFTRHNTAEPGCPEGFGFNYLERH